MRDYFAAVRTRDDYRRPATRLPGDTMRDYFATRMIYDYLMWHVYQDVQ
jgi:hypothetical protein